jgi:hypothetical protein
MIVAWGLEITISIEKKRLLPIAKNNPTILDPPLAWGCEVQAYYLN